MASPPPKPILLFIHGAWHQPAHFGPLIAKITPVGYSCVCPQQPSFDVPPSRMKDVTLHDDAACIRQILDKLIVDEQRDVLVVCHSYGGLVGTQATHESLGLEQRKAKGWKGGVLGMVFMCAFLLQEGQSLGDAFGGGFPPIMGQKDDGSCHMLDPRLRFYSSLSDDEAAHWLSFTRPHPALAQLTPITYAGYKHHPLTYVVCTEDQALPPEAQRGMAEMVKGMGLKIEVEEVDSDHSPWLSRESRTAEILSSVADRAG